MWYLSDVILVVCSRVEKNNIVLHHNIFTLEYKYLLLLQKDYTLQHGAILKLLEDLIIPAIHFLFHMFYIYFCSKMLL